MTTDLRASLVQAPPSVYVTGPDARKRPARRTQGINIRGDAIGSGSLAGPFQNCGRRDIPLILSLSKDGADDLTGSP